MSRARNRDSIFDVFFLLCQYDLADERLNCFISEAVCADFLENLDQNVPDAPRA